MGELSAHGETPALPLLEHAMLDDVSRARDFVLGQSDTSYGNGQYEGNGGNRPYRCSERPLQHQWGLQRCWQ